MITSDTSDMIASHRQMHCMEMASMLLEAAKVLVKIYQKTSNKEYLDGAIYHKEKASWWRGEANRELLPEEAERIRRIERILSTDYRKHKPFITMKVINH